MGQVFRKKSNVGAQHRITIQLQSETGQVDVLEVDEIEAKKDTNVKEVFVEKKSEMFNMRRVSILDRKKKLHTEDERLSQMDQLAIDRRKELETLLNEDD